MGSSWSGFGRGTGRAKGKMEDEVSCPLPQLQAPEAWRGGAYSRCRVSCRCAKIGGGWEGGAWQSSLQGGSLKAIQFPCLGDGKTGERVGGDLGGPHVQLCIFRGVLCLVPAVGIYVCVNLPFPTPCMTCDAADTTVLCAGVCWGHRGARSCPAAPSTL